MVFFFRRGMPQKAAKPASASKQIGVWDVKVYGQVPGDKVPQKEAVWKKFFDFFVKFGIYQIIMVPFGVKCFAFQFSTIITREKHDLATIESTRIPGISVKTELEQDCMNCMKTNLDFSPVDAAAVQPHLGEIEEMFSKAKQQAHTEMKQDPNFNIQKPRTLVYTDARVFYNPCAIEKFAAGVTTTFSVDKSLLKQSSSRASMAEAQATDSTTIEVQFKIPDPAYNDFADQQNPIAPPSIHKDFHCSLSGSIESLNKIIADAESIKDTSSVAQLTKKRDLIQALALTNRDFAVKNSLDAGQIRKQYVRELSGKLCEMTRTQASIVEGMAKAHANAKEKGTPELSFLSDGMLDVLGRNILAVQAQSERVSKFFVEQMEYERSQAAETAQRRHELDVIESIMRNVAQGDSSYLRTVSSKTVATSAEALIGSVRVAAEALKQIIDVADWQAISGLPEAEQLEAMREVKRAKLDKDKEAKKDAK